MRKCRPEDWGIGMTICVAAICDLGKSVVAITDTMLSVEATHGFAMTADNNIIMKGGGIHKDWVALYAGSVSLPVPIISETRKSLSPEPKDLEEVAEAIRGAYVRHLASQVATEVLSPGFDVESFYRNGLEELGEVGFSEKRKDFEWRMQNDPRVEFLVFGFDKKKHAHIFTIRNPGVLAFHDNEAFWAIGSGQQIAVTSLMFHQYNQLFPMSASIYHICEAKFMAERAPGIGKESFIFVYNKENGFVWYPAKEVDKVRECWEKFGRPSRPPQAIAELEKLINQHREMLRQGKDAFGNTIQKKDNDSGG